jgi:hypothetical protein
MQELKNLLMEKNIDVLSTKWISTNDKYKLRCNVCGNIWEAKGNSFFNSRRVAGCDKCSRNKPGNKKTLDFVIEFANMHDGEVISKEYKGRKSKYIFRCKEGHEFDRNLNNMIYRNQFCPIC